MSRSYDVKFKAKGSALKDARKQLNPIPSHDEMSKLVEMLTDTGIGSRSWYTMIENGTRNCDHEVALALSKILKVDVNELFETVDPSFLFKKDKKKEDDIYGQTE